MIATDVATSSDNSRIASLQPMMAAAAQNVHTV
ncbi:unnamed protein product [Mycetohabitans rhizoxinica HKI 454]|uniref:Uncharacterized protein n=1 Tax=Mycetohabitans rhizoxinica (strain DSM 19002 / CIP 109453 / HKI 454) TaxID=882378 RepID=E5ALU3_MYCRK|nr:unnamed protein product [Mycetohabitans rhizoxinica HKI 454]